MSAREAARRRVHAAVRARAALGGRDAQVQPASGRGGGGRGRQAARREATFLRHRVLNYLERYAAVLLFAAYALLAAGGSKGKLGIWNTLELAEIQSLMPGAGAGPPTGTAPTRPPSAQGARRRRPGPSSHTTTTCACACTCSMCMRMHVCMSCTRHAHAHAHVHVAHMSCTCTYIYVSLCRMQCMRAPRTPSLQPSYLRGVRLSSRSSAPSHALLLRRACLGGRLSDIPAQLSVRIEKN